MNHIEMLYQLNSTQHHTSKLDMKNDVQKLI